MTDIRKCQSELIQLAESKGYLTFDDIMHASDTYLLTALDVDRLSEAIQLLGIIVYEETPIDGQVSRDTEDLSDYSRTDYDSIFAEIIHLSPQMSYFIDRVKELPAPQWGEVNMLAKQSAAGNSFARERIIRIYMRSVLKIALSMTKQYDLDLEEAISTGFIGLIFAVERYDPYGFSAFHSYASLWIQQVIQRFCAPKWFEYYFPFHIKDRMLRALKKYEAYTVGEEYGSEEYDEIIKKIAKEMDLSEKDVETMIHYSWVQKHGMISWESMMDLEGDDQLLMPSDLLYSEEMLIEGVYQHELKEAVDNALSTLKPREREVIDQRYGLESGRPMTLEEIGNSKDLTRERIRQIEKKAIDRLRAKKGLREYWKEGKVAKKPQKSKALAASIAVPEEQTKRKTGPNKGIPPMDKKDDYVPTYWDAKKKKWVPYTR